jgi:hypothetical protein
MTLRTKKRPVRKNKAPVLSDPGSVAQQRKVLKDMQTRRDWTTMRHEVRLREKGANLQGELDRLRGAKAHIQPQLRYMRGYMNDRAADLAQIQHMLPLMQRP